MKTIVVTIADVQADVDKGICSPLALLRRLFKQKHGLEFEESEFMDGSRFHFYKSPDGENYRVDYVGTKRGCEK